MSYVFTATLTPKVFVGFVLGCCLILTPNIVHPAPTNSATLSWVANSESDLAGYKVYQGNNLSGVASYMVRRWLPLPLNT